ncbi:GT23 domain-containing protein, partial [Meloidogyne graminicola]
MSEYCQIPSEENETISNKNDKIKKTSITFTNHFKKLLKFIIIFIPFLLIYLCFKQHNNLKIKNNFEKFPLPNISKIVNKNLIISKDAYNQMTLVQKLIYFRSLFGYNSLENIEQKQIIDKQIIRHLSNESRFYVKYNNYQQLSLTSEKIQSSINSLQNPNNCSTANIMLLKYIWRENDETIKVTNQIVSRIPFECGPIVGIHVRRTDKITEAKLYELEDYMKWVNFWFDVNEENYQNNNQISLNCTNKRMLFVAADLSILKDVVDEVKNKWGNKYKIYHGTIFQNETQFESKEAILELLAVYRILAKCQFLVCTFSSNTCAKIYELMQAFQGDANENVHSLDYFYGIGRELEATTDYKPSHEHPIMPEELWAEKGDKIFAMSPIHQDVESLCST